uniref:Secreted protein n=1 Tax=Mesocestoides corti TaxID=53468 RepID=A0A5K3G0P9_MESCO
MDMHRWSRGTAVLRSWICAMVRSSIVVLGIPVLDGLCSLADRWSVGTTVDFESVCDRHTVPS